MSRKKLRTLKKASKVDETQSQAKAAVKAKIKPSSLKSPSRSNIKSPNRDAIDLKLEMKESLRKLQESKKLRLLEEEMKRRKRTEVSKFNDEIRRMNEPIVNKSPKRKKKKSLQELIPKMMEPTEQPPSVLQGKKSQPKIEVPVSGQKKKENLAEIPNSIDAGTNKNYLLKHVLSQKVSQKLQKQSQSKSRERILASKGSPKIKKPEEKTEDHFPRSLLKKIEQYQMGHSSKGLLRLGKSFKTSKKVSKTSEERSKPLKELKGSQIEVKRNKSPKGGSKGGKKKKTQKRFYPSGDHHMQIDTDMANTKPVFNFKKDKSSTYEINAKKENDNNFSESSMSRDYGERSLKNKPEKTTQGGHQNRKRVSESLLEISDYIEADPDKVIAEMVERHSASQRKLDSGDFGNQSGRSNRSHPKSMSQVEILLEQVVDREHTPRPETMIEIATKSKEQQDSQKTEEELCGFSLRKSDGEDPREVDSMVVIEKPVEISVVKHDPFQSGQKVTVSQQPKSVIEQSEPSKELETELRNSSVIEKLAKDQFMKWTEIGNMIQQIESRLGAKAASEMQELLFKVEKFTEQSKQGLKEKYLRGGDRIASSNPWEVKSRRSEDHALRHSLNESEFQGEMKKIREDSNASVSARNYPRWATRRSTECSRRTKWRSGLKPTSR
jgi:transcriptional regulator